MKLLYANDKPGIHAPSWYNASCELAAKPVLDRHIETQVCIIGAGYTGLSSAVELSMRGIDCVVLDAHRVGWGASGRNGGQLGSGFNMSQLELEALMGKSKAHELWNIAEHAKRWILETCKRHHHDIDYRAGVAYASHRKRFVKSLHAYCEHLSKHYSYDAMQALDATQLRHHVNSDAYHGGWIDHGAGHIHPLKLAHALADIACRQGASIYEKSEVIAIKRSRATQAQRVVTSAGSVSCQQLILATNGYLDKLHTPTSKRLIPINNFIIVTEPLGRVASEVLPHNAAVADTRFVVNYYRLVEGNRLLFGGGENYSYRFPRHIAPVVRKAMSGVFPQLKDTVIDYAWGGTLAITRNRLPFLAELEAGRFVAGGYSGHGVALACIYGRAIASHLSGDSAAFNALSQLPNKAFPGSASLRPILLALAMTGYSWLDRI